ncbi:unnamed protein product [Sphenostylis stenocarpa]|uniref:Uncharacterized protein n=1 Tax=Sphenostylis stenocarpa TaxID=92480 RepID=A0AA86TIQ4_9FABA|nr:unnamed protein product [Sphenostylis stenocarpa]
MEEERERKREKRPFTEKSQICRREEKKRKGHGHIYTSHHVKKPGVNEAGIAVDSGKDERGRERGCGKGTVASYNTHKHTVSWLTNGDEMRGKRHSLLHAILFFSGIRVGYVLRQRRVRKNECVWCEVRGGEEKAERWKKGKGWGVGFEATKVAERIRSDKTATRKGESSKKGEAH